MIINFFYTYLICLTSIIILDLTWLTLTINILYKKNIGHLMGSHFLILYALIFYLLYALGLTIFTIIPALHENRSPHAIFLFGALFGIIAYGTYDLTNHATLKNWPLLVTIVDMTWGGFMAGTTTLVSYYCIKILR